MSRRRDSYQTAIGASKIHSRSHQRCVQLERMASVHARDLLELAEMTVRELNSGKRIDTRELSEILYFLVSSRAFMHGQAEKKFSKLLSDIAQQLAPRIPSNQIKAWSPFSRSQATGREVRSRFFQIGLNYGKIEVANAFA